MELADAEKLARQLMRQYRLRGWVYATNKRKKTLGLCFSRLKRIELSVHFIIHNAVATVRETVLHEIAHAIVGTEHGHDDVWKAMAEQVGAAPTRTTKNVVMPPGKWQANCGGCGLLFSRYRRPKWHGSTNCRRCGPDEGTLFYRHIDDILSEPLPSRYAVAAHEPSAGVISPPKKSAATVKTRGRAKPKARGAKKSAGKSQMKAKPAARAGKKSTPRSQASKKSPTKRK